MKIVFVVLVVALCYAHCPVIVIYVASDVNESLRASWKVWDASDEGARLLNPAELTPEQLEEIKIMIKECKEKTHVTEEDLALIKQHKLTETRSAKCFSACIKRRLGIMDADNKISVARVTELMKNVKERDETKYHVVIKIFTTCAAQVPGGDDECEAAYNITKCVITRFKANDINVDLLSILSKAD